MDKITAFIKGNKKLSIALFALIIICIMFLAGWSVGYSPYRALLADYYTLITSTQSLQNDYDKLAEEQATLRTNYENALDELNRLKQTYENTTKGLTSKKVAYSNYGWLDTAKVRWLTVMLGKGDKFQGHLVISTRIGTEADWYYEPGGSIIFKVNSPDNTIFLDLGRIQDECSFEFVAEKSGDYRLVFNDPTYRSRVDLFYNSPTIIRNLDVMR